jgi:UV DNA damage repair endonuclease
MVKSHQKTIQPMKLYSSHRWILHVTGEPGIPGGFGNKGDKYIIVTLHFICFLVLR